MLRRLVSLILLAALISVVVMSTTAMATTYMAGQDWRWAREKADELPDWASRQHPWPHPGTERLPEGDYWMYQNPDDPFNRTELPSMPFDPYIPPCN